MKFVEKHSWIRPSWNRQKYITTCDYENHNVFWFQFSHSHFARPTPVRPSQTVFRSQPCWCHFDTSKDTELSFYRPSLISLSLGCFLSQGKMKSISDNMSKSLDPTPKFDSHISKNFSRVASHRSYRAFEHTQVHPFSPIRFHEVQYPFSALSTYLQANERLVCWFGLW